MIKFILILPQLLLRQIVHRLPVRTVLANDADGVLAGAALVRLVGIAGKGIVSQEIAKCAEFGTAITGDTLEG